MSPPYRQEGLPRPPRVMVVDDEIDIEMWEYTVRTVPDTILTISSGGLHALKKLEGFNYDVDAIVIDLSMPDKDGLSLTKEIREQEDIRSKDHPMKIFWCSGSDISTNPTLGHAFEEYQVTAALIKPITPDEIMRAVHEYI